jgi:type IV pilus assembly protein PilW
VDQLRNVVAVKLYVLARNLQETAGYEDTKEYCLESPEVDSGADCSADALFQPDVNEKKYKRHLFSSTIRLVNVSGRRETP